MAVALSLLLSLCVVAGARQSTPQSARSPSSPLIDALYLAARQTNEKDASQYLEQATLLLNQSTNVNATGRERRTALHWAVIGSMTARGEPQIHTYYNLVQQLLTAGADVNAEDEFGATPLDYQENSPTATDLTFVLLDSGARNGSGQSDEAHLKALFDNLNSASQAGDLDRIRADLASDLPIGTELSVRLTTGVDSHLSRVGDVIEAVVVAPVVVDQRVALASKTRIRGTVMLAQRASSEYQRAQLILNFVNFIQQDGATTQVLTRLIDVDNARESVQAGRIVGLPFPNVTKLNWGLRFLGVTDPVLSYALESAVFVRDREYKRTIDYPPGTDMTLTVEHPVKLAGRTPPAVDSTAVPVEPSPALIDFVASQPVRTETVGGMPSDLTNLLLIGTRQQMDHAFQSAGWLEAEGLSVKSGLKTFAAVAESRGYSKAPVSLLLLDGRKPDVVYQKQTNTFAKRHHVRIWKASTTFQGSEVWIAAAVHDIGVGVQKGGRQWFHRIDPQVDRERAKVTDDLAFAGVITKLMLVDRPSAPRDGTNATGDRILTDGKIAVVVLR